MYVVPNNTDDFGGSVYDFAQRFADAGNKAKDFGSHSQQRLSDFEAKFDDLGSSCLDEMYGLLDN